MVSKVEQMMGSLPRRTDYQSLVVRLDRVPCQTSNDFFVREVTQDIYMLGRLSVTVQFWRDSSKLAATPKPVAPMGRGRIQSEHVNMAGVSFGKAGRVEGPDSNNSNRKIKVI